MDRTEMKKSGSQQTFLACVLFCHFRPHDNGTPTPQRTVSFKFRPMHVHPRAFVCIFYDKTEIKIPWRKSRGLNWDNKT